MAELNESGGSSGHGEKKGAVRAKKMSTKIDMTPMVDLAFLLVTFFMLTTTFSKPTAMQLIMPEKPKPNEKQDTTKVKESEAITIIVAQKNRVFYYKGISNPKVVQSDYSANGLRKVLMAFDTTVRREQTALHKKEINGPVVLIKPIDDSQYGHVVDVLDEMKITGITRYAIVTPTAEEIKMLPPMGNN